MQSASWWPALFLLTWSKLRGVGCILRFNANRFVGVLMVTTALLAMVWSVVDRRRSLELVQLAGPTGTLSVELADTPTARASGLSNRDAVTGDGLLLRWDSPGRHPIWMADMRFALDLVWLDERGAVLAVLLNVPPCRREPCPLHEPHGIDRAVAVLELPAGDATRREIAVGVEVRSDSAP